MKTLIIIIALFLMTFAADPLDKIDHRNVLARTKINYKKSDDAAAVLTLQEWNALPAEIKDQWANYGTYVSWAKTQINAGKQAIRDQLQADRAGLLNNPLYDAEEETQYRAELQAAIDAIVDINGAK